MDAVVNMWSDVENVGAYKGTFCFQKGFANNGDSCGVYLHLKDGPFPCHVSFTIELVHWDGEPESTRKRRYLYMNGGDVEAETSSFF